MVKPISGYTTSDGKEFKSEAEALKHEALHESKEAYLTARSKYAKALSENHKTADGQDFEMSLLVHYYEVVQPFDGTPYLQEHSFYLWRCDVDDYDEGVIITYDDHGKPSRCRISQLYLHRQNAEKALLKATRAWVLSCQERLEILEKQFEKSDS